MIRIYPYIFSLLACIGIALPGYSQVDRNETLIRSALHGLEYEIKAGFSIGGTAPLPLPVEIRSIDGYNPTLAISIGGEVTKWIAVQNKLGIIVGLRLENKAMTTEATVKNYNIILRRRVCHRLDTNRIGAAQRHSPNIYFCGFSSKIIE